MKNMKLRGMLVEKQIPQYELAKRLGVSEKTMSGRMNGLLDFSWSEIVKICKILDIENPIGIIDTQTIE